MSVTVCVRMSSTTIVDLPTELIESFIFPCLSDSDIKRFGETGLKRFEDIASYYLSNNKCK